MTDLPGTVFWEEEGFFRPFDVLIIGSGLVGLSAAIEAQKHLPGKRIAVVERGALPSGASTRNAGFGCFGSPTELLDDLAHMEKDDVWALVEQRWRGLQFLRRLVGDQNLHLESFGGYEVFLEGEENGYEEVVGHLEEFNHQFKSITGHETAFREVHPPWQGTEMRVSRVLGMPLESQLQPARMMHTLLLMCREKGIQFFNGLQVEQIFRQNGVWACETTPAYPIRAHRVLVANNGFARSLLPELEVQAVRNQVLITEPLGDAFSWKGCFHYHKGYVYFRNVGDRILLGGFRHLDQEIETTDQFGLTPRIQEAQERWFHEVFRLDTIPEFTHRWSGILGVGAEKRPVLKEIEPGLMVAVRLGGMGVALGSLLGKEAMELFLS